MNQDLIGATTTLAKGHVLRFPHRPGDRVECVGGALWLTQEGDRRDVILMPGDAFEGDRKGTVTVQALSDARLLRLAAS